MTRPSIAVALATLFAASVATQDRDTPTALAEMQRALDALEPEAGWLATPKSVPTELWEFYRATFRMAPERNEPDAVRIGLGRLLFFDTRLSRDRTLSCATCHDPRHGFGDRRAGSIGIGGARIARNAPTIMNAALQRSFFWDGRAASLEEQAAGPILNSAEMGMPDGDAVVARLRDVPEYVALFELAYGRPPAFADVGRALAAFQRTLIFLDAPFDAFWAGDQDAISADARAGFELFTEHCRSCHPVSLRQPLFSDGNFHNVGIGVDAAVLQAAARQALPKLRAAKHDASIDTNRVIGEHGALGRVLITRREYHVGSFRTPQLRNVGLTGPYMHDGSLATLWDVVAHYNRGGNPNTWLDPRIVPLGLSDLQIDQIVAFLFSLTDRRFESANAEAFRAQRDHQAKLRAPSRHRDLDRAGERR